MIYSELFKRLEGLSHGFGIKVEAGSARDSETAGPAQSAGEIWRVKQVHGDTICDLDLLDELPPVESIEADAIVTSRKGLAIGVRTADCAPLLVADQKQPLVAVIHSGWRGTVAKISLKVIQYLQSEKGSDPSDLFVAIGPCIQGSCYEVGEEVTGVQVTRYFDMVAENQSLICEGGVLPDHIEMLDYCTHCRGDLFHSYRRDGERAGRQISWIQLL